MYPQHLARLDDDGSVRRIRTGTAGGSAAGTSPTSPEVPAPAPLIDLAGARRDRRVRAVVPAGAATLLLDGHGPSDAWPLPLGVDDVPLSDAWLLLDVHALSSVGRDAAGQEVPSPRRRTPAAVVAAVAGGGVRHRRPSTRSRRPAIYLAAALIGVAGLAVTAAGEPSATTAQADEPVSVADELGLVQAEQPAPGEGEAASRLQQLMASRAERQDAEAAAAQAQAQADQAAAAAAAAAAAEAARPKVVLPVQGATLSSGFGPRWGTLHAGLDFAAPIGTPEYAAMDGVVVRAGAASGFGLAVYIQHANGDVTVYGHMEQILVSEGQAVKAGDTIALLGQEGESTGPHLHFEVHAGGMDGERIDPLPWLLDRGVQV